MKQMKTIVTAVMIFLSLAASAMAAYTYPVIIVDGRQLAIEMPAIDESGRTMVPVRAFFEEVGATVGWDEASQTITIRKADREIKLTLGENTAYVNGVAVDLSTPPANQNGRILVPLRFVAEAIGAQVSWDQEKQAIMVATNLQPIVEPAQPGTETPAPTADPDAGQANPAVPITGHLGDWEPPLIDQKLFLPALIGMAVVAAALCGVIIYRRSRHSRSNQGVIPLNSVDAAEIDELRKIALEIGAVAADDDTETAETLEPDYVRETTAVQDSDGPDLQAGTATTPDMGEVQGWDGNMATQGSSDADDQQASRESEDEATGYSQITRPRGAEIPNYLPQRENPEAMELLGTDFQTDTSADEQTVAADYRSETAAAVDEFKTGEETAAVYSTTTAEMQTPVQDRSNLAEANYQEGLRLIQQQKWAEARLALVYPSIVKFADSEELGYFIEAVEQYEESIDPSTADPYWAALMADYYCRKIPDTYEGIFKDEIRRFKDMCSSNFAKLVEDPIARQKHEIAEQQRRLREES